MNPVPCFPADLRSDGEIEVSLSDLVIELQQENVRLKLLVSELLVTNQKLRRED